MERGKRPPSCEADRFRAATVSRNPAAGAVAGGLLVCYPRRRMILSFRMRINLQAAWGAAVMLLCALAFSNCVVNAFAQDKNPARQPSSSMLGQELPGIAAKYKIPGLAVASIEHGQIRDIEVFGVRDTGSSSPVDQNTVFQAGGLGEPVYAYSILKLAADGQFNPGAPLPTYLALPYIRNLDYMAMSPGTEALYDSRFNQITALRVMNHTSGMPDWSRNGHLHLQTDPGRAWSYSNEGYLYLQQVVEHVTHEPTNDFVSRSAFVLAQMGHSSFLWRDSYNQTQATGYDRAGNPVADRHYLRPAAATTLYTTIQDYAQFLKLLLATASAQRAHESAVSLMLNPTAPAEVSFSWGLGCGLEKSGDDVFFFNRGMNPGFQSFFLASRKAGKGLVILTNSENGLEAVPEIVAAALGGNHPIFKSVFLRPH